MATQRSETIVTLSVELTAHALVVPVTDNGRWRSPNAAEGRGLPNMRLRAERIGATWSITRDEGCTVRLELPHATGERDARLSPKAPLPATDQ